MASHVNGVPSSPVLRRRSSTHISTGLDYPSSHAVDEDIMSRIRTLLLSRNNQKPPATPHTSEEHPSRSTRPNTPLKFDFSTARSIATFAKRTTDHAQRSIARTMSKSVDVVIDRRPSEPDLASADVLRPLLRTSSSVTNLHDYVDPDSEARSIARYHPDKPSTSKQGSWLSKLSSPSAKRSGYSSESSLDIATKIAQGDEMLVNEILDSSLHDPFGNQRAQTSKSWTEGDRLAQPVDVACFLAGCSPGQLPCTKDHGALSVPSRVEEDETQPNPTGRASTFPADHLKLGQSLSGTTYKTSHSSTKQEGYNERFSEDADLLETAMVLRDGPRLDGPFSISGGSPNVRSTPRSSITSTDRFPHAMQSLDATTNNGPPALLSTAIATNFSLPSHKAREQRSSQTRRLSRASPGPTASSIPWKDIIKEFDSTGGHTPNAKQFRHEEQKSGRPAVNEILNEVGSEDYSSHALHSKETKSPSLLSGMSKTSAYRHSLLKPSVSGSQPIDLGLPIPPVLTPNSSSSLLPAQRQPNDPNIDAKDVKDEKTHGTNFVISNLESSNANGDHAGTKHTARGDASIIPDITVDHSLCQKDAQLLQNIKSRTREAKETVNASSTNDGGNSTHNTVSTPTESSQAAYMGLIPIVKEVVHDAVKVAVRNVVSEVVLPPGSDKEKTAEAYRRAVAHSLTEAGKDVDEYLRRPSLWSGSDPLIHHERMSLKPCHRLTCLDDPHIQQCNHPECVHIAPQPLVSTYTWRGNDCELCPHPSDKSLAGFEQTVVEATTKPNENLEIPSATAKSKEPISENLDQLNRSSKSRRNAIPAIPATIPDRGSSRKNVLKQRKPSSNSGGLLTQLVTTTSRKHSYERLSSGSDRAVRPISSVDTFCVNAPLPKVEKQKMDSNLSQLNREFSDADSLSYLPSDERLGRKNTVHWLRNLLSNPSTYESRLTALPPRTRRDRESESRRRSHTAPQIPVTELYLESNQDNTLTKVGDMNHPPVLGPDGLSKTINELEDLLNEALSIARKAADKKSSSRVDRVSREERSSTKPARNVSRPKVSDEYSLVDSVHESLRSLPGSSDGSEDTRAFTEPGIARSAGITIIPALTSRNNPSGWPPTGRVSRPYPPNTQPPSSNSAPLSPGQTQSSTGESKETPKTADVPKLTSNALKSGHTDASIEFHTMEPFRGEQRLTVVPALRSSYALRGLNLDKTQISPITGVSCKPRGKLSNHGSRVETIPLRTLDIRTTKIPICRKGHSQEDHDAIKLQLDPTAKRTENIASPIHHTGTASSHSNGTYSWQDIDERHLISQSVPKQSPVPAQSAIQQIRQMSLPYSHSLDGTQFSHSEEIDFRQGFSHQQHSPSPVEIARTKTTIVKDPVPGEVGRTETTIVREREIELRDVPNPDLPTTISSRQRHQFFNLENKRHVSLRDHKGFSFARSHKRQAIARDWSPGRKRFCAAAACISTALVGILVGIYAGETPAIQYWIVDFHHYTVLGNVFFFIGLSIPTFLFWPLPLLHGRKPYILGAMSLAMPLLFPQALAVGQLRSPYTHVWRVALILPRALMGFCLGFANMNFKGILTDLFGASLQSTNPHQEHVDEFDVRRHGGGMGAWLGLWTWSAMGSIGLGFLIGAAIINTLSPAWGFYVSIIIIAFVLLLNVLTPEVRRSAFRRSVAEVKNGDDVSRRLARGEVKMHLVQTGPKWWGEEFHYGVMLSVKMLRQPGFMIMAVYVAWMYGQIVLIVLLLGSLCSNRYRFLSPQVGAAVSSIPLGALLAIPFQKASLFSRDRNHAPLSDDDTYKKKIKWSSHLVRRAIFVLTLPFAGLGYTLTSGGPPIPFILPILFAGLIGFLSNLAMAECHGIIMETFDTSDLQPGMTGRTRGSAGDKSASKRTNYSSFPRVSSGFAITQGLGYLIAAAASGVGGTLTRSLGQQAASGVMAFILLVLSILLLGVLVRFKNVQIIPDCKKGEMDRYHQARRRSVPGAQDDEPWRPIIIGNPHHSTRRMCILELGSMSRFSEIRRRNRLVDEQSLEARHPNAQMMMDVKMKIREKETEVVKTVRRSLSRQSSRGSRRSMFSEDSKYGVPEQGDLGGLVEVPGPSRSGGKAFHSTKGSIRRQPTGIIE